MPDDQDARLSHGDTVLATRLRQDISEVIERETETLIRSGAMDHDAIAGRIRAFQDCLRMIDGTYQKINDVRPSQEAPRGN